MALSLKICSYNIHGYNDTKCDYIQSMINNHAIVMLQEHWLYNNQSHVFQDKLTGISYHI